MRPQHTVLNVDGVVAHSAKHDRLVQCTNDKDGVMAFCKVKEWATYESTSHLVS